MDQPRPWLKYVDAGDLEDNAVDFDGINVESPTGEHLGDVDGFIVDSDTARPYYVVVDAGGWFKSRHFLLPVGHARLDIADDGEAFVADLRRDQVEKFPGFDIDEFDELVEADLKRINDETCAVCGVGVAAVAHDPTEPYSTAWDRPDYRYPDWWSAAPTRPDRMGEAALTSGVELRREQSHAPQRDHAADSQPEEQVAPATGDVSPHFGGRAQPGDVIGIETGGEQTHVGESAEDENERREEAQKAAVQERPTRR